MSHRGDIRDIRVFRVDTHAADLPRIAQADMLPVFACVGRFVNAVAMRDVAANRRFAHPDVDHVGVRKRNVDRPDRAGLDEFVRDRLPIHTGIRRLPNAAARRAKVINVRLRRHARHRRHPPAAKRPDLPVLQQPQWILIRRRRSLTEADTDSHSHNRNHRRRPQKDTKTSEHKQFSLAELGI